MKPKKKLPKDVIWDIECGSYMWLCRGKWRAVDHRFVQFLAETEADEEREASGQKEFKF